MWKLSALRVDLPVGIVQKHEASHRQCRYPRLNFHLASHHHDLFSLQGLDLFWVNKCIYVSLFPVKQREALFSVAFICLVLNKMLISIWPSVASGFDILLTFLRARFYSRIRSCWAPCVPKLFSLLQLILKCHLSVRDGELCFMKGTLNFKCHQTPHTCMCLLYLCQSYGRFKGVVIVWPPYVKHHHRRCFCTSRISVQKLCAEIGLMAAVTEAINVP